MRCNNLVSLQFEMPGYTCLKVHCCSGWSLSRVLLLLAALAGAGC